MEDETIVIDSFNETKSIAETNKSSQVSYSYSKDMLQYNLAYIEQENLNYMRTCLPLTGSITIQMTELVFAVCNALGVSKYVKFRALVLLERLTVLQMENFKNSTNNSDSYMEKRIMKLMNKPFLTIVTCIRIAYKFESMKSFSSKVVQKFLRKLNIASTLNQIRRAEQKILIHLDFKLHFSTHLEYFQWLLASMSHGNLPCAEIKKILSIGYDIMEIIFPHRERLYMELFRRRNADFESPRALEKMKMIRCNRILFGCSLIVASSVRISCEYAVNVLNDLSTSFGYPKKDLALFGECINYIYQNVKFKEPTFQLTVLCGKVD